MQEIGRGFGGRIVYVTSGETTSTNIFEKYEGRGVGRIDKDHREVGYEITVITMQNLQSLHRALRSGNTSRIDDALFIFRADLIFADEVHHYLTPQGLGILATFLYINPQSYMIGASATEGYNLVKNSEQQFGKCLHRVGLSEAVEEEVLISPHVLFVKTGASLDSSRITPSGDFVFDPSIPLRARDQKLLESYLKVCEREGRRLRTVSYLSSIDHAYDYAELCEAMRIPCEVIIDGTKNRDRIYERLRQGQLGTVATVNTAVESLDLPWLDGTLHSAQTRSMRVARQMFPRSMRNIPGKSAPWIIQAVDEKTSWHRRPLVAPDILGQTRFANGSIIVPKSAGEDIPISHTGKVYSVGVDLAEGTDVDVEVIDIRSLFKMGILDRAVLLGKGLLPQEEVEKFRAEINELLTRKFEGEWPPSSYRVYIDIAGRFKLFDEITNQEVSLAHIAGRVFDTGTQELRAIHWHAFQDFLRTGKLSQIDKQENTERNNGLNENFIDPEFAELCDKFKTGKISENEKRVLAATLRSVWETRSDTVFVSNLGNICLDHEMFRGSAGILGRLLGINIASRVGSYQFSSQSRTRLFEFINQYSEGEELGASQDKKAKEVTSDGTHPEFGDVGAFLKEVFEDAQRKGIDIRDLTVMTSYRVPSIGRLSTIAQKLGIRDRNNYNFITKRELSVLLMMAGIEA